MTSVSTSESALGLLGPSFGSLPPTEASKGDFDQRMRESKGCGEEELAFAETPVAIVDSDGLPAMGEAATSRGYLWVLLKAPGPQYRGRLGLYLEESIETQLEERGALPPGIQASTGLDASLSDQLYRARLVEMRGIAIGIPSLEGIVNLARALDAEDSAVLRWWMAATADRPVRLVLSHKNTNLRVYPSPVLFETLFEVAPEPVTPLPPSMAMASSARSMELSDLPPMAEELTSVLGTEVAAYDQQQFADTDGELQSASPHWDGSSAATEFAGVGDRLSSAAVEVALPELDAALGLSSPQILADGEAQLASEAKPSAQLQLDYEDSETLEPEESETLDSEASSDEESRTGVSASGTLDVAFEAEPIDGSGEQVDIQEGEATPMVEAEAPVVRRCSVDVEDDLDAEDFLRTLEEDSSRAPEVELKDEFHESETAPLATKRIASKAFIRMAAPEESVAPREEALTASGDDTSKPEEPSTAVADGNSESKSVRLRSPAPDPDDPFNQLASREWKGWVKNLEAARGPKPLSAIERMFVTDYTRLREAVRRGVAEPTANAILDEWQASFELSYSQAFDTLRMRGKRPTMVLDLPELAARLGRLQGAKRVQLLLVDALRFDLGLMVQDKMRPSAKASLTERLLLWSALPSVTSYQLDLLGRGPDGLKDKDLAAAEQVPDLVARGKAASMVRKVRTGKLDLLKLDIVEDSLRSNEGSIAENMGEIAEKTADALVHYLNKQPPRTMVVVFGDHGFSLTHSSSGSAEVLRQGGASPEEILVPAFAWLTGAVH